MHFRFSPVPTPAEASAHKDNSLNKNMAMRACLLLLALFEPTSALFKAGAVPKSKTVAGVAGARGKVVPTRGAVAAPAEYDIFLQDPAFQKEVADIGITAMRLGTCALMVHHGFDKIQSTPHSAQTC